MIKLKNEDIQIGELGEERTFVSGIKNWRIQWATLFEEKFKVGDKVSYFDTDSEETFIGIIDWMIVTETGNVEVSLADTDLGGRVDLEDLEKLVNNCTFKLDENSTFKISDVNGSAIVSNKQIALYFQFDDDEPLESMKCNGKEFTIKILPMENGCVEFTDGKKKFKMFARHCS